MTDSSDVLYLSDETSSSLPAPRPLSELRQSLHTIIGLMDNQEKDKSKSGDATFSVIFESPNVNKNLDASVSPVNRDTRPVPSTSGTKASSTTVEHGYKKTAQNISHTHPKHNKLLTLNESEESRLNDSNEEESESTSQSQTTDVDIKRNQQEGSSRNVDMKRNQQEGSSRNVEGQYKQTTLPHAAPSNKDAAKRAKQSTMKTSQAQAHTPKNNPSTNEYAQFSNDESTSTERPSSDDIAKQETPTHKHTLEQEVRHVKSSKPHVHNQEVPRDLHETSKWPYPYHADVPAPYPPRGPWAPEPVHRCPVKAEDTEGTKKVADGITMPINKGSLKEQFVRFLSSLSKRPSFTKKPQYSDHAPLAQNMIIDAAEEKTPYGLQQCPSDRYILHPGPSSQYMYGNNPYPKQSGPYPMVHLTPSASHMRQSMASSHSWHAADTQRQEGPDLSYSQHPNIPTSQQCPMEHGIFSSPLYYFPSQYVHGYSLPYMQPDHMKTGQYNLKTTKSQSQHSFHKSSIPVLDSPKQSHAPKNMQDMNIASEYRNTLAYSLACKRNKKKGKEEKKVDSPAKQKDPSEKEEPVDSEPTSNKSGRDTGDDQEDQENDDITQKEKTQKTGWLPLRMEDPKSCDPHRNKFEIYYFDHGNAGYFRTTDNRPPVVTENFIEQTDYYITKFWAEVFGSLHIGFAFLVTFLLQLYRFVLFSLLRPIMIGLVQLTSDYLIKAFLSVVFNGVIQPLFILLFNVATSIRDLCEPLAHAIGFFLHEVADLFNAIRLVEANDVTYVVPSRRPPLQRQAPDLASYMKGETEESKEGTPPI